LCLVREDLRRGAGGRLSVGPVVGTDSFRREGLFDEGRIDSDELGGTKLSDKELEGVKVRYEYGIEWKNTNLFEIVCVK
jgi:hypothetical protein